MTEIGPPDRSALIMINAHIINDINTNITYYIFQSDDRNEKSVVTVQYEKNAI